MRAREQVLAELLDLLGTVVRDLDVDGGMTEETRLFEDLDFESLDLVVLGTAVQERYEQNFPFAEFFAKVGQREQKDVSVGEWVDFVCQHLEPDLVQVNGRGGR